MSIFSLVNAATPDEMSATPGDIQLEQQPTGNDKTFVKFFT